MCIRDSGNIAATLTLPSPGGPGSLAGIGDDEKNFIVDGVKPTMTITASQISNGGNFNGNLSLTFTTSEATSDFIEGDITLSNGTLSSFTVVSSTSYTATFTPSAQGAATIDVASGKFTDSAGNTSSAATQFAWTYDVTAPTMTITSAEVADGGTSNDGTLALTFTSSEATTTFTEADITVSGGALSAFNATSTTVYTATFTPTASGATTIDVAGNKFTDAVGNNNTCLLYTSPSPRDLSTSRMPSSA